MTSDSKTTLERPCREEPPERLKGVSSLCLIISWMMLLLTPRNSGSLESLITRCGRVCLVGSSFERPVEVFVITIPFVRKPRRPAGLLAGSGIKARRQVWPLFSLTQPGGYRAD